MNKATFAKNAMATVCLVIGILLFGLGAAYISAPSFGFYWIRSAAVMAVGICLILFSLRAMWRQQGPR